ncbi:MAG: ATP-binding protein [Acidobacteriota bacterium]|nr:ATP-binding protein [Acidobacteriota bacterium]
MHNPFTIGSMIQNSAEFVGRTAELQFLLTRLRSLQSCSVVGERRIGKSSLLYHLHQTGAARLSEELGEAGFRFVYVELADAAAQTVVDFLRTVLDAVQCPTDGIKDDNKPSRNLTAFDQAIKARAEAGERLVLCLDEFEALFENPAEFNNAFFNHLRTMVNHRRLALVTASRQPLEIYSLEKRLTSPFFNVLSITALGDFTEAEALQFLALHHPHVNFTEDELRFINSWLDPHPLKLQILCDQVLQNRQRLNWQNDMVKIDEVEKVCRQFLGEKGVKKNWYQFKGKITLDSISKTLANLKTGRDLLTGK